jgi:hypothetical protein
VDRGVLRQRGIDDVDDEHPVGRFVNARPATPAWIARSGPSRTKP